MLRSTTPGTSLEILALLCALCPGCPQRPSPAAPPRATPRRPFPAARLVPAEAPLVVLVREPARLFAAMDRLESVLPEVALRGPLDRRDLRAAGLDPHGSAGLYSIGTDLTLVLAIEDRRRLAGYFGRPGSEVKAWAWRRLPGAMVAVMGDHLLLSLSPVGAESTRADGRTLEGWLEDTRRSVAESSLAASGRLDALLRRAGEHRDLVAFLRPLPLNRATSLMRQRLGHRRNVPRCNRFDQGLAAVKLLGLALSLRPRQTVGEAWLELSPAAHAELQRAVRPPFAVPATLWDRAPARVRLGMSPDYLRRLARDLPRATDGCGAVADALIALEPARLMARLDLLDHVRGQLTAVALSAKPRGRRVRLEAAAVTGMPGTAVQRLIAFLVAGPWARWERVAGRRVHRFNPPSLVSGNVLFSLGDDRVRIATSAELMAPLYEPAPRGRRGDVVDLHLEPGRLDLQALAETGLAARLSPDPRRGARVLGRFDRLWLGARLGRRRVRFELGYRLSE